MSRQRERVGHLIGQAQARHAAHLQLSVHIHLAHLAVEFIRGSQPLAYGTYRSLHLVGGDGSIHIAGELLIEFVVKFEIGKLRIHGSILIHGIYLSRGPRAHAIVDEREPVPLARLVEFLHILFRIGLHRAIGEIHIVAVSCLRHQ